VKPKYKATRQLVGEEGATGGGTAELATYIAEAARHLNQAATQHRLSFLAYLLELVEMEARNASSSFQDSRTCQAATSGDGANRRSG
jgi:hypothetical protein